MNKEEISDLEITSEEEVCIKITLKEYKELLEIKDKYEELKSMQPLIWFEDLNKSPQKIEPWYYKEPKTGDPTLVPPYKITCKGE